VNEAFLIYRTVVTAPLKIEPADFDVWMDAASDLAEVMRAVRAYRFEVA